MPSPFFKPNTGNLRLFHIHIDQQHRSFGQAGDTESEVASGDGLAAAGGRGSDGKKLPTILVHLVQNLGAQHVVVDSSLNAGVMRDDPRRFQMFGVERDVSDVELSLSGRATGAFRGVPARASSTACLIKSTLHLSDRR